MNNFVWRSNYSPFCRFTLYLETKIRNNFSVIIVWLLFFVRRKGRDWGRYPCALFIKRLIILMSYKRVDQKIFHMLVYGNICIILNCLYIMRLWEVQLKYTAKSNKHFTKFWLTVICSLLLLGNLNLSPQILEISNILKVIKTLILTSTRQIAICIQGPKGWINDYFVMCIYNTFSFLILFWVYN